MNRFVSKPSGVRFAAGLSAVVLLVALLLAADFRGDPRASLLSVYYVGMAAGILALAVAGGSLIVASKGSEANGRWKTALVFICLGNASMLNSLVGILCLGYGITNPVISTIVQASGIFTYIAWPIALFALPAKRMLLERKLPWILDVALMVTAISGAGWFFLVAPQVKFGTANSFWLTFAYPVANLVSVAGVVAAMSLGGPFRSARGLLMAGITINVAGDVIQAIYALNRVPIPSAYIHCLWLLSTLLVALAALQVRIDLKKPAEPATHGESLQGTRLVRALIPVLFLAALVSLALWGNWTRPHSRDVIGLNIGCLVATAFALVRLLCLIKDNSDLARSLSDANANLDSQVRERTQQLSDAKDEMERQEAFLRAVIDALPSFVVAQNLDGSIRLANEAAARLFGRSAASLQGSSYADVASATNPNAPAIIGEDTRAILGGEPIVVSEREIVGADRETRIFEVVKTPVAGRNGKAEQVLIVGNDVTVRKEAEQALISARDAAEETTRVKSEFLANMSHEIRTPMNGVIGLTDLLLSEELPVEQRALALKIKASGESLLAMVNEVLDLSRLDSGHAVVESKPCSLATICAEVGDAYRYRAEEKSIALRVDVHLDPSKRFLTDPTRVRQILGNLLSNAIKFTAKGTVSLDVDLVAENGKAATIRFSVSDTGIGIPESQLERIFDSFSQVDNSMTRRYGGAGLGLSLCRKFVALLDGTISVESREGEGSRFVVELSMERVEDLKPRIPSVWSLTDLRVLVVEDNPVNQMILQHLLEQQGCAVDVADNGLEAVERLRGIECDLVLMDCQMPVMDGLEATRQIRQFDNAARDVPIIAVTANAMEGDREKCIAAGMDDYVPKPIRLEALTEAIGRVTLARSAA